MIIDVVPGAEQQGIRPLVDQLQCGVRDADVSLGPGKDGPAEEGSHSEHLLSFGRPADASDDHVLEH